MRTKNNKAPITFILYALAAALLIALALVAKSGRGRFGGNIQLLAEPKAQGAAGANIWDVEDLTYGAAVARNAGEAISFRNFPGFGRPQAQDTTNADAGGDKSGDGGAQSGDAANGNGESGVDEQTADGEQTTDGSSDARDSDARDNSVMDSGGAPAKKKLLVTYEIRAQATAKAIKQSRRVTLIGTNSSYADVMGYATLDGGFFSKDSFDLGAHEAVLNEKAASTLFGGGKLAGNLLRLNDELWTVVGVVRDDDADSDNVYVPATCALISGGDAKSQTTGAVMALLKDYSNAEAAAATEALASVGVSSNSFTLKRVGKAAGAVGEMCVAAQRFALIAVLCFFTLRAGAAALRVFRAAADAENMSNMSVTDDAAAYTPSGSVRAAAANAAYPASRLGREAATFAASSSGADSAAASPATSSSGSDRAAGANAAYPPSDSGRAAASPAASPSGVARSRGAVRASRNPARRGARVTRVASPAAYPAQRKRYGAFTAAASVLFMLVFAAGVLYFGRLVVEACVTWREIPLLAGASSSAAGAFGGRLAALGAYQAASAGLAAASALASVAAPIASALIYKE